MGIKLSKEKDQKEIKNTLNNKKNEELENMILGLVIFHKKIEKINKINEEAGALFFLMVICTFIDEIPKAIQIGEQIKQKHQFISVYLLLATCYFQQNLLEDAENCFKQVLEIKPQKWKALLGLYELCMKKEDYQNALNYIDEIKKFNTSPGLDYLLGVTYQKINEHEKAIQCFEQAHQVLSNQRYFTAKMESFIALEKYEEALECCKIAWIYDPSNKLLQEKLQKLIQILGIEEDQNKMSLLKLQQEHNYTLETYKEKRELEAQQTQLIKRQSKIKVIQSQINQTQSQIKINRQNQQIIYYLDAIYFTFTYFFVLYTQVDQNCSTQIAKYLSTKQNVELLNFTDMIRATIQKCYPDLKDLKVDDISNKLTQWYNKKLQNDDIYKHLYEIFFNLIQSNINQKLIERLNEDFPQSIERKNKNKDFYLYLTEISHAGERQGFTIFKESGGQLGLEHAIIILGFMIKFTELVDENDSFEDLLFRGLNKEDFHQFFQSQSRIKKQTQQPNQESFILQRDSTESMNENFFSKFL